MLQGRRQRTFRSSGQANQAVGVLFQFFFQNGAFSFFRAQFHLRDQTAKILIARAGGNEKGESEKFVTETETRNLEFPDC